MQRTYQLVGEQVQIPAAGLSRNHLDVNPKGGAYVYSSSEAFTEEQKIDFWRLSNWISFLGMHVYGFEPVASLGADPVFHRGFHAPGHMPEEQLQEMIFGIEPEMLVPVNTIHPEWLCGSLGVR